jgi:hypothetical protein
MKSKENCGVPKSTLNKGYSNETEKDDGLAEILGVRDDYIGADRAPEFIGNNGFLKRRDGWER